MQRTSLEVSKQFNVPHARIMYKIESFIRKEQISKANIKEDTYYDSKKINRSMYFIDQAVYKKLVDWHMNKKQKVQ